MGNKERAIQQAKYRHNIGREFGSIYKKNMDKWLPHKDVESLYHDIEHSLRARVSKMNTPTLARIIEATPEPRTFSFSTHLLEPRKSAGGLDIFEHLSGRDYLEILALCAIVGAVHDYWKDMKWRLKGKDREGDRYYFFPCEYSSKDEAEAAADRELLLIKARTGKGVLPDRVYIIQPDGVEYQYATKEPV